MSGARRNSVLDGPAARLVAVGVALACVAVLGYIHRDDLFPPEPALTAKTDDPFQRCFAKRAADIGRMAAEGLIKVAQAALFRARAEAMCRDRARNAQGGGATRPGLPPGVR